MRDGLFRASWQWKQGRLKSAAPANLDDLQAYTSAFLSTMDAWLSASNRRRMRAEIYELTPDAPLRVVRFVLENTPGPSVVRIVSLDESLSLVLSRIGERTRVRITDALVGMQDLRVHARDEVSIIKPAERRNWLGVRGLEDADAVVKDSAYGGPVQRDASSCSAVSCSWPSIHRYRARTVRCDSAYSLCGVEPSREVAPSSSQRWRSGNHRAPSHRNARNFEPVHYRLVQEDNGPARNRVRFGLKPLDP